MADRKSKEIYDWFLEIRARRNLLVHRGQSIDKEYIDLCHSIVKAIQYLNLVMRLIFTIKKFLSTNRDKEKTNKKRNKLTIEMEQIVHMVMSYILCNFSVFIFPLLVSGYC